MWQVTRCRRGLCVLPKTSPVVMVSQLEPCPSTTAHTPCMLLDALSLSSCPRFARCRGQSCASLYLYLHKKSLEKCSCTSSLLLLCFYQYTRLHRTLKQKETCCTSVGVRWTRTGCFCVSRCRTIVGGTRNAKRQNM